MKVVLIAGIASTMFLLSSLPAFAVAKDPRLCSPNVTQLRCARGAAVLALRRAIAVRDHLPYPLSQGLPPNCIATKRDWLNFRCTFRSRGVDGSALVWLGRAPLWKPTVHFLS